MCFGKSQDIVVIITVKRPAKSSKKSANGYVSPPYATESSVPPFRTGQLVNQRKLVSQ